MKKERSIREIQEACTKYNPKAVRAVSDRVYSDRRDDDIDAIAYVNEQFAKFGGFTGTRI